MSRPRTTLQTGGTGEPVFLFSIDLEDVRSMIPNGMQYAERVPQMTRKYLEFLRRHAARCTFFVVGQTARAYPELIREIIADGHEIACHSDEHLMLTDLDPNSFRDDVRRSLDTLAKCGAEQIMGFRAPTMSLVERSSWAYEVLEELGFTYSSSVIPTRNPLYGWEGFGTGPQRVGRIIELPLTLSSLPFLSVPFAAGVYFRVLPWFVLERCFRTQWKKREPVLAYFHPYDIDTEQERFMHPKLDDSRFKNHLMFVRRKELLSRLDRVLAMGWRIRTYRDYVRSLELAN